MLLRCPGGWGGEENGRLHRRREKDVLSERAKAEFPSSQGGDLVCPQPPEHLDIDKRALKEPVFSSSWS